MCKGYLLEQWCLSIVSSSVLACYSKSLGERLGLLALLLEMFTYFCTPDSEKSKWLIPVLLQIHLYFTQALNDQEQRNGEKETDEEQNRWTRTGRSDEEKREKDGLEFGSSSVFPEGLFKPYSKCRPVTPCPHLWIDWMGIHTYIHSGTHKI